MSDILISGYYGFKNSGDDALLLSIVKELKENKENINITVLSQNPEETEKIYKVRAVKRDNICSLIKSIISTKMVLMGGGTLIQDGTSTKSLLYYLLIIKLAKFFGKKVMLYSNGIGPLKEENYKITRKILNKVDLITLRDEISNTELKKAGVTKPKVILTADSAFNLSFDDKKDISELKKEFNIPEDKKYFCIAIRNHKRLADDFCDILAEVCDKVSKDYNIYPVFIPFQKSNDTDITNKIRNKMKSESRVFDSETDISDLLEFISHSELCIGMRLHSLIYSVICKVPLVGLVYDPKIVGFMEYIGQENFLSAENLKKYELIKMVNEGLNNSQNIRIELGKKLDIMRDKAKENAKLAIELLDK